MTCYKIVKLLAMENIVSQPQTESWLSPPVRPLVMRQILSQYFLGHNSKPFISLISSVNIIFGNGIIKIKITLDLTQKMVVTIAEKSYTKPLR